MKAARFYSAKENLKIEEVEAPKAGANEVLVKVKACGICGTDIHIAKEGILPTAYTPITLGHEVAGEIADISTMNHFTNGLSREMRLGDKVLIFPQELCGQCPYCKTGRENLCLKPKVLGMQRDGGMAQFIKAPANHLIPLPDSIPFEIGAILADAVATPYHAIVRRGKLKKGETVAIFGCGGLGYHAIKICKSLEAGNIVAVDIDEKILERAQRAGADVTIHAKEEDAVKRIKSLVKGGVDLAFEFIGLSKTVAQAVQAVRRGGRAVVCGIGMKPMSLPPPFVFVGNEISLLGSFGSTREDISSVINLIAENTLELADSVTETFALQQANTALERLHQKQGYPIRLVILPAAD